MGEPIEYVNKRVLSLAPDALVYINGSENLTTCLRCNKESLLVEDISSISVTITMEGENQASFEIVAPRYEPDRWMKGGKTVVQPLHEVEIYMRGRYLVSGEPRYWPVFWGIVQTVSQKYSDGRSSISVSCTGILRWWEMTRININPAINAKDVDVQMAAQPWINIFGQRSPYEILWHLALISTGGLLAPDKLDGRYVGGSVIDNATLKKLDSSIVEYWRTRFLQVGRSMRMFGFNGEKVTPDPISMKAQANSSKPQLTVVMNPRVDEGSGIDTKHDGTNVSQNLASFKSYGQIAQNFQLFQSEFTSKRELAVQVANAIGYEFYQDATGEIFFKPPFYNVDVKEYLPFTIEDLDIISLDITENEREVVTRVDVTGCRDALMKGQEGELAPYGFYVDPELVKRFGVRVVPVTMDAMHTAADCFNYAVSELDRLNKRRWMGNLVIVGRPELRVGWPIYIKTEDIYAYVTNVSHNFQFGGTFQTTVGLEAIRRKKVGLYGEPLPNRVNVASLTAKSATESAQVAAGRQATGTLNAVSSAIGNSIEKAREAARIAENKEIKPGSSVTVEKKTTAASTELTERIARSNDLVQSKGVPLTSFVEVEDPSILSVQVDRDHAKIPHTDRNGYEVIGGFPYGRNIELTAQGELRVKGSTSQRTSVGNLLTTVREEGDKEFKFTSDSRRKIDHLINMKSGHEEKNAEPSSLDKLDPSMDPTLSAERQAVAKGVKGEGVSILNLQPEIRFRQQEYKCKCGREDKDINRLPVAAEKNKQPSKPEKNPSKVVTGTSQQLPNPVPVPIAPIPFEPLTPPAPPSMPTPVNVGRDITQNLVGTEVPLEPVSISTRPTFAPSPTPVVDDHTVFIDLFDPNSTGRTGGLP